MVGPDPMPRFIAAPVPSQHLNSAAMEPVIAQAWQLAASSDVPGSSSLLTADRVRIIPDLAK